MKRILAFLRPYWLQCVLAPLFKLLEACFELFVPLVVAAIIDRGIAQGDDGYILKMCGVLALLAVVGCIFAIVAQYFAARAATGFATATRLALFDKLQSLSYRELDAIGTPTMIARLTTDVTQAQTGVNLFLRLLMRSPFVVFGALIMAWVVDPPSAGIFAMTIPVLALIVVVVMVVTVPMYRKTQEKRDRVLALARENVSGARVIRAFGIEEEEREGFHTASHALNRSERRVGRLSALTNPLTYVVINVAIILILRLGAFRVESGDLTQGQVIALYNYMSQILVELIKLANLIVTVTKAIASGKRMGKLLEMESSISYPETQPAPLEGAPAISFDGVALTYGGAPVAAIHDVSFSIPQGGTIGIIGGTGAGKSSLVNLIPRFYDATEGTVSLFGVEIGSYPKETLREMIAVVPQKAVLFSGTIRDNLLWGDATATDDALYDALRTAQALSVVDAKPQGLDTPVEAGGKNFSGGERQRLTIARALVKRPKILILDDSASALDYATDAALRRALREDLQGMTVVVVSQRVSSVRHADTILVLQDGEVVGMGDDATLRATCPVYCDICRSQEKGGDGK